MRAKSNVRLPLHGYLASSSRHLLAARKEGLGRA